MSTVEKEPCCQGGLAEVDFNADCLLPGVPGTMALNMGKTFALYFIIITAWWIVDARNEQGDPMNILRLASVVLITALLGYGCSDSESTPGLGFIPKIRVINMYNVNDPENPTYADTYHVGDSVSFGVRIEDNDLDLKTLVATESLLGSDTPLNGPDEIPLGEQTSQLTTYWPIFPITISGPAGDHLMEFVAVDLRGNRSSAYPVVFTVEE